MAFTKARRRLRRASIVGWMALVPMMAFAGGHSSPWRLPTIIFGVAMVGVTMLLVQVYLLELLLPLILDRLRAYMLGVHDGAAGRPPEPGRRLTSVG